MAFWRLMRLISLLDVNHRFWRTIGKMRASATALRNRFRILSWLSPARNSTLMKFTSSQCELALWLICRRQRDRYSLFNLAKYTVSVLYSQKFVKEYGNN